MVRWVANRCYDCLAVISWNVFLCDECLALYQSRRDVKS